MAKRPNAYTQALSEKQRNLVEQEQQPTAPPENSITAKPQNSKVEPVQQTKQDEEKATEKLTLYLFPRQSDKLDELLMQYKKRTGKRIQRNKVMRKLINQATLETLLL